MKQYYYPQMRSSAFHDGVDDGLFDVDYIALLAIVSVILEVYSLQENDKQQKDNVYIMKSIDKVMEKQEKIDGRLKRIERLLERSVYDERR